MSWLRTDDAFPQHPKFEGWPASRRWAWFEVMHYCARYQTQGRIPNDLSLLPKSATESLLNHAEISGWIDRDSNGDRWIHDWHIYNPKDPTKAQRQAKWRANRNARVDDHVDTDETDVPSTETSTSRARLPSRPSSLSTSAAGSTPGRDETTRDAAELRELAERLDELNVGGNLRQQALADPHRALVCAKRAERSAKGNPAGYFRRLFESGDTPSLGNGREHRPYDTSADPVKAVRAMIHNGAIADHVTLQAELRAYGLNGADEQALTAELEQALTAAPPDTEPQQ